MISIVKKDFIENMKHSKIISIVSRPEIIYFIITMALSFQMIYSVAHQSYQIKKSSRMLLLPESSLKEMEIPINKGSGIGMIAPTATGFMLHKLESSGIVVLLARSDPRPLLPHMAIIPFALGFTNIISVLIAVFFVKADSINWKNILFYTYSSLINLLLLCLLLYSLI